MTIQDGTFTQISDDEWASVPPEAGQVTWAETFITAKSLVPSREWILQKVVPLGAGTRMMCGRIMGQATAVSEKWNEIKGERKMSVRLESAKFESVSFITGETKQAGVCYLPNTYALAVMKTMLEMPEDSRAYDVNIAVGIEVAKSESGVPYRWGVLDMSPNLAAESHLRRLRGQVHPVLRQMMIQQMGADKTAALIGHDQRAAAADAAD